MSKAMEMIVAGYASTKNRKALEDLRSHCAAKAKGPRLRTEALKSTQC